MYDLACAIEDCSVPVTVTRYFPARIEKGRAVGKAGSQQIPILASVQPMSDRDMMRLPEGFRTEGAIKLYTEERLRTVEVSDCRMADTFEWQGVPYEVKQVHAWNELGNFYKVIATRAER